MTINPFSFAHSNSNAVLAYRTATGSFSAKVRVSSVGYTYGVASDESHARLFRAFYPHRRTQGQFALQADCIHYAEYKQLVNWLKAYSTVLLNSAEASSGGAPLLTVSVPSRNFTRLGFITTGMDDNDHVASMVFHAKLIFVALADPTDSMTSILTQKGSISYFQPAKVDVTGIDGSQAFYPSSVLDYHDPSAPVYDSTTVPSALYLTQAMKNQQEFDDIHTP